MVDEITRQPLADPVARCLAEGRVVESPGHAVLVSRDGKEYSVRDSAAPIYDRSGAALGAVLVFKDVTQLRGMEREMVYLASHDALTGLINRREFEVRLKRAIRGARAERRQHVLLYLDLDEFKVVNDTCGHLAGDEMLKQVTALLRSRVRRSDVLARLGGDEFGVLLEDCPLDQARADRRGDAAHRARVPLLLARRRSSRSASASAWCRSTPTAATSPTCSPPPTPPATWPRTAAATASTSTSRTTPLVRRALRRDAVDPPHPPRLRGQAASASSTSSSSRSAARPARGDLLCEVFIRMLDRERQGASSPPPSSPRPSATT